MYWKRFLSPRMLIGLLLLVVLGVSFLLVLAQGPRSTVTEEILKRKQTIARAEAVNISSYFQSIGNSVAVFGQLRSINLRDATTIQDMDVYVEQRRKNGLIGGILMTDKTGVVEFNSNVMGTRDLGANLADRDYFIWAKDKSVIGEYFLGQPVISRVGASKGEYVVPVAAGVYQGGNFDGVIVTSVLIRPLTENYLELMMVSDETDVYLISQKGDLLYNSSVPDTVGSNIFELTKENSFTESRVLDNLSKNILTKTEEGRLHIEEYLVAYSPIDLGSQKWMLIMSSPFKRVTEITKPFFVRQISVFVLAIITTLLFGAVVIKDIRIRRS